jgi:hypothetical protein
MWRGHDHSKRVQISRFLNADETKWCEACFKFLPSSLAGWEAVREYELKLGQSPSQVPKTSKGKPKSTVEARWTACQLLTHQFPAVVAFLRSHAMHITQSQSFEEILERLPQSLHAAMCSSKLQVFPSTGSWLQMDVSRGLSYGLQLLHCPRSRALKCST